MAALQTPCLLLDEARMMRNIERLRTRPAVAGVQLRPHLKTVKPIAHAIAARSREAGQPIPVLIEVDCDGHRAGVEPRDRQTLVEIGRALTSGGAELRGVMVHAGSSYGCRSILEIEAVAELERLAAVQSATTLREAGFFCPTTPVPLPRNTMPTMFCAVLHLACGRSGRGSEAGNSPQPDV